METSNPVVIIGAGVSGLTCAHYLHQWGIPSLVLEAADAVGGRVRTDLVDGYRLDRGFQILLTAYPEAQRVLDYSALRLGTFRSGAVIRGEDSFMELVDPRQEPLSVWRTLLAPIGSLADKLRILKLILDIRRPGTPADFFSAPDVPTETYLRQYGWSEQMIRTFFRPFFGGVFLEDELSTSSNFFRFVFRQFFEGAAALPAAGMQAIPDQLAAALPAGTVRLQTRVAELEGTSVRLDNGEVLRARQLVVATDARSADRLLGTSSARTFNSTTCTYFAADRSPSTRRMLLLNPDRRSVVHHVCVPSDIAPGYAPAGKVLISVSGAGSDPVEGLEQAIRSELRGWFGTEVEQWRHLRTYQVPEALVHYGAGSTPLDLRLQPGMYRCGDYTAYPSLNAAMQTGRQVATMIRQEEKVS
jgi:phytoene dehydrogenase-like protein